MPCLKLIPLLLLSVWKDLFCLLLQFPSPLLKVKSTSNMVHILLAKRDHLMIDWEWFLSVSPREWIYSNQFLKAKLSTSLWGNFEPQYFSNTKGSLERTEKGEVPSVLESLNDLDIDENSLEIAFVGFYWFKTRILNFSYARGTKGHFSDIP